MTDGAHLGVSAGRALKTVLGGDEPPREDEQISREEMEKRIRERPLPGDGPSPWKNTDDGNEAYSIVAESLAHAYLVLSDERPELVNEQRFYDGSEMDDQGEDSAKWWREHMAGKRQEPSTALWEAFQERWPEGNDWLGGISGFQAGWAYNAVRFIRSEPPAGNPAIMTIGGES